MSRRRAVRAAHSALLLAALAALLLTGCTPPDVPLVNAQAEQVTETQTPSTTPSSTPTVTASPVPTSTALPATPEATASPTPIPELPGSFDAYLSAPDGAGEQLLRFFSNESGQLVTEVSIRPDDGRAVKAGQYVYFHARGSRAPQRVTSAGYVQPVLFAEPLNGATDYQLLPSANGAWLAWVSVGADRSSYILELARADGSERRMVATGDMERGAELDLIRVTNDGQAVFFSLRPPNVPDDTPFHARHDIYQLNVGNGTLRRLPGEPACGEDRACDAHISPDGAYLARTLPPISAPAPVVVTNLFTDTVIGRFAPGDVTPLPAYTVGYPMFTPGGELIYTAGTGGPELTTYFLVWANIVTGQQRIIAELGGTRHRPLGWTGEGFVLLTTREPDFYDTWQIDLRDGTIRQIASMLYLGTVEVPASAP